MGRGCQPGLSDYRRPRKSRPSESEDTGPSGERQLPTLVRGPEGQQALTVWPWCLLPRPCGHPSYPPIVHAQTDPHPSVAPSPRIERAERRSEIGRARSSLVRECGDGIEACEHEEGRDLVLSAYVYYSLVASRTE